MYSGDAISIGIIEFNKVNSVIRIGRAIYYGLVQIWDGKSGKPINFTTHFTFITYTKGLIIYIRPWLTFFLAPFIVQTARIALQQNRVSTYGETARFVQTRSCFSIWCGCEVYTIRIATILIVITFFLSFVTILPQK